MFSRGLASQHRNSGT
ncbi:hypothetical protein E2C01_062420 [Portunus trituberculatus]|uniref:Uncharacterized protein n=1 Tax=Portunus trituberculatus TaxID=210409 RepID=A0A5B7HDL4_PORTR|nr:hypothetical protein [Portunus trituberculatus]